MVEHLAAIIPGIPRFRPIQVGGFSGAVRQMGRNRINLSVARLTVNDIFVIHSPIHHDFPCHRGLKKAIAGIKF